MVKTINVEAQIGDEYFKPFALNPKDKDELTYLVKIYSDEQHKLYLHKMKKLDVTEFYRSSIIDSIKEKRRNIDKKMKNTLQAVSKHKYCDVLEGFGNSDITYNLSFNLLNRVVKELSSLTSMNTTQGEFLTKLGILERAEILSKKMLFSEKADIYFRIKRLIDKNQMGELFKVMLITTNKNKFKLGF